MTRLLSLISPGYNKAQCDARCYDGKAGASCRCICQGTNHGKGKEFAIENTRQHWKTWLVQWEKAHGETRYIISSSVVYKQECLPGMDDEITGSNSKRNYSKIIPSPSFGQKTFDLPPTMNYIQNILM